MKGDTFKASTAFQTTDFMYDLLNVFRKHGMMIVPTYEGEVSLHDSLRVVPYSSEQPYDSESHKILEKYFMENTSVDVDVISKDDKYLLHEGFSKEKEILHLLNKLTPETLDIIKKNAAVLGVTLVQYVIDNGEGILKDQKVFILK